MKHEEKLALGRVCGCGECEYCEEVWLDRVSRSVETLMKRKQKEDGYVKTIMEYKHPWQKSK